MQKNGVLAHCVNTHAGKVLPLYRDAVTAAENTLIFDALKIAVDQKSTVPAGR